MIGARICAVLMALALATLSTSYVREPYVSDVYITAAHLPVSDSRYVLIHENKDLDKAYYLDTEYLPEKVAEGTEVSWLYNNNTYKGTVVRSDAYTFYVLPANPELIVNGMSGSEVSGIGFISSYTTNGLLKVVYY